MSNSDSKTALNSLCAIVWYVRQMPPQMCPSLSPVLLFNVLSCTVIDKYASLEIYYYVMMVCIKQMPDLLGNYKSDLSVNVLRIQPQIIQQCDCDYGERNVQGKEKHFHRQQINIFTINKSGFF